MSASQPEQRIGLVEQLGCGLSGRFLAGMSFSVALVCGWRKPSSSPSLLKEMCLITPVSLLKEVLLGAKAPSGFPFGC